MESAIRDSAHETARTQRAAPSDSSRRIEQRLEELAERFDQFSQLPEQPSPPISRGGNSDLALFASIDALNDRVDALMREVGDDHAGPAEVRVAIQRLDDRIEELLSRDRAVSETPELEHKVDDISRSIANLSRRLDEEDTRRANAPRTAGEQLDAAVAEIMRRQAALDRTHGQETVAAEAPALDLSRLESQLKTMADEMQAIRRASAQTESIDTLRRDIGALSRNLTDLAPSGSLKALEASVEGLARRLDNPIGNGPDETLREVVTALHDIRSALADVRPAESFTSIERTLHELSNKLDHLHNRSVDGGVVARLQEQASEIRELISSALPSDLLKALVERIELLVSKFENGGHIFDSGLHDVIADLNRRVETLSDRVEVAGRRGLNQDALEEVRARMDELQSVIVNVGQKPSIAVETSLRSLSQKIDAAEARLENLGSIERGLQDLFGQLQELRSAVSDAGMRPNSEFESPARAPSVEPARQPAAELELKRQVSDPRRAPSKAEAVPAPIEQFATIDAVSDPDADTPLEPGSGAPRMRLQSAALRIAQSEAALDGIGTPASAPPRTSDFIAAARRAAQAAAAEPGREPTRFVESAAVSGIIAKVGGVRRALLVGLAASLLIFTSLRFYDGSLTGLFFKQPAAPMAVAPKPAEPEPSRPETATAPQDRSSLPETSGSAFAGAPPAGVIGGNRDITFLSDTTVDPATTGTTKPAKTAIQTAATPSDSSDGTNLPATLGTASLRAAAVAGDPLAAYEIGARYLEGRGVRADPAEAVIWLERAHARGSAPAAYRLGNIYEKGHGVTKNGGEAMRYYTLAAEAGNVRAMHNLAVMFSEGPDGKPDYRTAARWFRMAAERGVRDSQYNLGVLYARGLGVEQNLTESFRWFSLAANQGDSDASKKRDDVGKRLDVQTLVAAKLAVQTWSSMTPDPSANDVQLKPEWDAADGQPRKRSVKK